MSNQVVHLIDTPGFDDSGRSDSETLQELAYWLAAAYERKIQLSGIVYLHRITDNRLRGTAYRGLRALKAMCGDQNLRDVVIATTMWDKVAPEYVSQAFARHEELRKRIHRDMGDHGGRMVALTAGSSDAIGVVEQIIRQEARMTLAFQRQLVEEDRPLHETDVGRILFDIPHNGCSEHEEAFREVQETMLKSVQTQTEGKTCDRKSVLSQISTELNAGSDGRERMQRNLSKIRVEWEQKLKADREALEQASLQTQERFAIKNKTLQDLHRQQQSGLAMGSVTETEMTLVKDLEDLGRREEVIVWRSTRRLDRRHAHGSATSSTFGVIGASLAVGQLIATMACTVM
jgi:hypothetical protein